MNLTFEHVFALLVEDTCPGLKILASEKVGDSERLRSRRARLDGLSPGRHGPRLSLLRRWAALLGLLLSRLLLHHLLLAHSLRLELLDVLRYGHAVFLGLGSELALHELDLFRSGLLSGTQWRRHRTTRTRHRAWHWLSSLRSSRTLVWRCSHYRQSESYGDGELEEEMGFEARIKSVDSEP